jgi:hypothetical protein
MDGAVIMTCMTTKKKFDVVNPEVTVLKNGRYAFKARCPWEGKNGKILTAFKFCSGEDFRKYQESTSESEQIAEGEQIEQPQIAEGEQIEQPQEP